MAPSVIEATEHVAWLSFRSTHPGSTSKRILIFPREQFDVGREHVKKLLGIEDLTISTHHLRFRCVVYEEDDDEHGIAPMIYFRVLSFNSVELKRTVAGHNTSVAVSRTHGDVLLGAGDVLQLTPEIYLQFQYQPHIEQRNALNDLQRAEAKCFANEFLLSGRRLGVGGQASVFIAVRSTTKRQFACKALPLPHMQQHSHSDRGQDLRASTAQDETKLLKARNALAREYDILGRLNHPNIVSLEKVICASNHIYIFQELITGGDLSSFIDQNGALSEPESAVITFQLLQAINHLHGKGYCHRDIKPENILMTSWREGARVVLTDFGQARAIDGESAVRNNANALRMSSIVGTYGYTAPEIFQQVKKSLDQRGYSKAVDIWSLGCVTAILLTGEALFDQDAADFANAEDAPSASVCRKRWNANQVDSDRRWVDVSKKAKSFVKGCLDTVETVRMTAKQALLHDWLANKHYTSELAAAYERTIADWRPRQQKGSLIEFIDTTDAVSASAISHVSSSKVAETKSKHFEAPQKAPVLPASVTKKAAPSILPQAHPPPQAAMSRDAKTAGLATAAARTPDPHALSFVASQEPTASAPGYTYASTVSTAPFSIWQYGPPQTQSLFRQYDSVTQAQPVPARLPDTQLTMSANPLNVGYGEQRIVDSQVSNVTQTVERPRKKVCR